MRSNSLKLGWKFWLGTVSVLFNLSLAGWWLWFGLNQAEMLRAPKQIDVSEIVRVERMLLAEGWILLVSIALGGGFLLYYIISETRRNARIREFFASFSHELKTSIASLRVQVESLEEDLRGTPSSRLLERLSRDSVKLEIQLENSLVLAELDSSRLYLEKISLEKIVASLARQWPELRVKLARDSVLQGDRRALDCIFRNLAQNALVHGSATELVIDVADAGSGQIRLTFSDNGRGFQGQAQNRLGELFFRHQPGSGSGVGLHLSQELARKQGGRLSFELGPDRNFLAHFNVPGQLNGGA